MNMIKILPNETSAGHDNINYKVCKLSGPVLAKFFAAIFDQCIKEDTFPSGTHKKVTLVSKNIIDQLVC